MLTPRSSLLSITFSIISILLASSHVAIAQTTERTNSGFRLGASLNSSELYFDKEVDALNDIWDASAGYQIHFLYEIAISNRISVLTGLELISNRYKYNDLSFRGTNEFGEPNDIITTSRMDNSVGVTYLGLPVHVWIYPLKSRSLYIITGPDLSLKIGHQNSRIWMRSYSDDELIFSNVEHYTIPERSRDHMLFASAGIGYRLDSALIPMDIQLKARHSITTYMADESFVDHWVRSAMVTVSYRL